jgi:hypothetical protein
MTAAEPGSAATLVTHTKRPAVAARAGATLMSTITTAHTETGRRGA